MSEEDSTPPTIDFNTFVLSLSTSALMHLGKLPDGESQTVNLAHAKQSIDCIALLEEKTKGNLTGEEERLISEVLYDLREDPWETKNVARKQEYAAPLMKLRKSVKEWETQTDHSPHLPVLPREEQRRIRGLGP